jgi:hypothetical protein
LHPSEAVLECRQADLDLNLECITDLEKLP